jgi:hypothetical protein
MGAGGAAGDSDQRGGGFFASSSEHAMAWSMRGRVSARAEPRGVGRPLSMLSTAAGLVGAARDAEGPLPAAIDRALASARPRPHGWGDARCLDAQAQERGRGSAPPCTGLPDPTAARLRVPAWRRPCRGLQTAPCARARGVGFFGGGDQVRARVCGASVHPWLLSGGGGWFTFTRACSPMTPYLSPHTCPH